MKYLFGIVAMLGWTAQANAQEVVQYPQGLFVCDGVHPRCTWVDQSTYPYHQFGGQHVGQMSGVSDVLENGPPLIHYQTFLTELISQRPDTNAVAFWADAASVVNNGRVWGGFISARSGFSTSGADSQLIGLEIDVLNGGLPGVYPNASKVGLQIVGFGNPNTNAIEILTETPSAAFQNIINIHSNSVSPTGSVIGMAPNAAALGINFFGSTFSDAAFLVSENQRIAFRTPGLGDASIYRDNISQGYLVLQAGPPGLRIVNSENNTNLLIVESNGDIITRYGRISSLFGRSTAAASAMADGVAETAAAAPGAVSLGAGANASGDQSVALGDSSLASGTGSTAVGAGAQSTGSNSVALGAASTDDGEDNVVAVGSAASTRRVTHVSAGVRTTDAVNVGQLNSSIDRAISTANAYTDSRVEQLGYDLGDARRDAEGGTASAMALAGIPQSFERGKGMVGVGFGTWQGESALAVGVSKATDNGLVFKIGGTYNSRGQGGASGGMGIAF